MPLVFFALILLLLLGVSLWYVWIRLDDLKPKASSLEKTLTLSIIVSFLAFLAELHLHTTPYFKDIDPFVEKCYSPISFKNGVHIIVLHLIALFSMMRLYSKSINLPPLQLVGNIIFVVIGIILNIQFIVQVSYHDLSGIYLWQNDGNVAGFILSVYPILLTIASIFILKTLISQKAEINKEIVYKSKWLNRLNQKLCSYANLPLMSILLVIPMFILVVVILILFGQEVDLLNKAYSETATWRLSEHIHPPTVDDRHSHYLCTVAAHGSPKLVKPIAIGIRNNQPILVNRQLQIANAFECIIENAFPKIHKIIRTNYNHYGLNLAKRINTQKMSNLTYLLMKPLEWAFLIIIYTFDKDPEKLIGRQYN